jgi:hypothetical protein
MTRKIPEHDSVPCVRQNLRVAQHQLFRTREAMRHKDTWHFLCILWCDVQQWDSILV